MGGAALKDIKVFEHHWRINSYQNSKENNFKVRMGCHFTYSQGDWEKDNNGFRCSHEIAGIGLTDNYYKNSQNRFRSAGIRQLNNRNTLPGNLGQLSAQVNVYGR